MNKQLMDYLSNYFGWMGLGNLVIGIPLSCLGFDFILILGFLDLIAFGILRGISRCLH